MFGPLAMHHTTADLERARALGLGDAHRMWFGLALARTPLFRADLAPAGFIVSTADDMAHPIEMLLAGGVYDGRPFLRSDSVAAMTTGAVQQPIGTGRYAMGWVDDTHEGLRTISHDGSTTDMAALQAFAPESRTGIVVLANAQGIPYETFGKIDAIGIGALDQMLGRQPTARSNTSIRSSMSRSSSSSRIGCAGWRGSPARAGLGSGSAAHGVFVGSGHSDQELPRRHHPGPAAVRVPGVFSAPWSAMIRTDVGVVILSSWSCASPMAASGSPVGGDGANSEP